MKPETNARQPWWSMPAEHVFRAQNVDIAHGLDKPEAVARLARFGPNQLRETRRRSPLRILVAQFLNLMMLLLAIAALLAFFLVDVADGIAIVAVIALNVSIGFVTELKAERSMAALYRLGQVSARVRRSGKVLELSAAELVPGDVVVIDAGDVVTADIRIASASRLQVNESALTGESVPVDKTSEPVTEDTTLADRSCMLFKGTSIVHGSGEGVVVGTGLSTELGQITSLVEATADEATPLEQRLNRLARRLIFITLLLASLVTIAGVVAGRDLVLMLQTAIALAIATVPEGLPIVATIALARGMWRMARHKALVTRLSAVETLGATGVICTDKTGTITENRMTVVRLETASGVAQRENERWPDSTAFRDAWEICALCSNAELGRGDNSDGVGDPMEIALLRAARENRVERDALLERLPEVREEAFDVETRMMATIHRDANSFRVAAKGAPEAVIEKCTHMLDSNGEWQDFSKDDRAVWLDRNADMAKLGLRVLALASATMRDGNAAPYENMAFVGLVGFVDPARDDVRDAIARCRAAGIDVVLVTGDHAETARFIARDVGLIDMDDQSLAVPGAELRDIEDLPEKERERLRQVRVFARVNPRQKLDLVSLHQSAGHVVAMTGDGVNDAPALKKADIGIAMGLRGTQVAREAADMILKDDAFGTIVVAVAQGRIIFDNIRKFVLYLLACNLSEVLVIALAMMLGSPLPLLPLQILFLNLVTDVFPALALGVGPGDRDIMSRPPRPESESILVRRHWITIAGHGLLMTAAVLFAFYFAQHRLQHSAGDAITVSFLTLALAQLWHVFSVRSANTLLPADVVRNPWIWAALLVCLLLLASAIHIPMLADVLQLQPPTQAGWVLIVLASLFPWSVVALGCLVRRAWNGLRLPRNPASR